MQGANVENAAYPVGTCAERVAMGTAVVQVSRIVVSPFKRKARRPNLPFCSVIPVLGSTEASDRHLLVMVILGVLSWNTSGD